MLAIIKSAAISGVEAKEVVVEIDVRSGLPAEIIVGLPDTVIKESKTRIKSAVKNSEFNYPAKVYTINLAPADLKKEGPFFDLPIALGILQATSQVFIDNDTLAVGELSLDGNVRPVRGMICICQMAVELGFKRIIIPYDNYQEAKLISGIKVLPVKKLGEINKVLKGDIDIPVISTKKQKVRTDLPDYIDVKGQEAAKRAIEIAAAGKHNILIVGPPGSGKTMILKRLPSVLPEMSLKEAIDVHKVRSVSKNLPVIEKINFMRPFRNPHHSISCAGLAGGGSHPLPGEISLAHHGVLFLDELPEFTRQALEILRQPVEEKKITITRAGGSVVYPADFMFAAAMNPCPCGYYNDMKIQCNCNKEQIKKYWKKISGPMLDRIDIIMDVPRLKTDDLLSEFPGEYSGYGSLEIKNKVQKARSLQEQRYNQKLTNSDMSAKKIDDFCKLTSDTKAFLGAAIEKGFLTGRSYNSVLKVSRTIADLDGQSSISLPHICEALQYRKTDLFISKKD
ncbi:MAG: YifB family Mg chelatase-like AAA ATPase [bacterium]|nr:YifB family Mg chelatase-like AAA ATPase [bacterium]